MVNQEYIEFWDYIISKEYIDILIPLFSGMLGIVIGGIISYLSVRASDNRKWKQEKKDRLLAERRDAIGMALEWFDPFRAAITKASLLTGSFLQGTITREEMRSQWPDLLRAPGLTDPPARLQIWLRDDAYRRSISIITDLNNLVSEIYRTKFENEDWHDLFVRYSSHIHELRQRINSLEDDLIEEYKRTYE
jgi:hypothetical protein